MSFPHPITYSNNPLVNIFEYDTNFKTKREIEFTQNKLKLNVEKTPTPVNLIMYGDQTNAVPGVSIAY